jgi:hypothetical protein
MIPGNFFIQNRIQGKVIKCKHHPHLSIIIITCNWSLTRSWNWILTALLRIEKSPYPLIKATTRLKLILGSQKCDKELGRKKTQKGRELKSRTVRLAVWTTVRVSHLFRDHPQ